MPSLNERHLRCARRLIVFGLMAQAATACNRPGSNEARAAANEATPRPPGGSHPPTGPSRDVTPREELCSTEERVRVHSEESGEGKPQLRVEGVAASEVWRGSLSHEIAEDRIVRFADDCGNWGECAYAVYLACEEGDFVLVYGPEYFVELEPFGVPDESGFVRLRGAVRTPSHETPGVEYVILRFRHRGYQPQQ